MSYTLEVRTTTGKKPKFIYTVNDKDGNVISQRQSFRKYVAATIHGNYYFGRLDLIGKSDHGKSVRWCKENGKEPDPIAFISPDQVKQWDLESDFETYAEKQFNQQHPEANP